MADTLLSGTTIVEKETFLMVDRGDPTSPDFDETTLTTDGTWQTLDLSGIVPAGTKFVYLVVLILDDATDKAISFRKNGNGSVANLPSVRTQVANISNDNQMWVACDDNRIVEYIGTNNTFTQIDLTVSMYVK